MPLENSVNLLLAAKRGGYCVGAFNAVDYLTIEAIIRAAETHHSPVIIQTSQPIVRHFSPARFVRMVRTLADTSPAPVGLHLDHGTDETLIRECIRAGYTSVMIDASAYPFDENAARTRQVVAWAHAAGLSVEGEIGVLGGMEDDVIVDEDEALYTTPAEAIAFQAASGVDFLAVAIGTAHGFYKKAPRLDIPTLRSVASQVDFPLVVHGGTGLPFEVIRELVAAGAAKLNVSTQLKKTYSETAAAVLAAQGSDYHPFKLMTTTLQALVEVIGEYMDVFGSTGRAS